ncbi:MAG: DUF697 domain-containing protein [Myxococcales bacterium]|nr:DUF697 domain-containing protein [Myxococcales bacterium]
MFGKNRDVSSENPPAAAHDERAEPHSHDDCDAEHAEAKPHELPPTSGADAIVRKWSLWAAGFGLVPLPLLDFATTTGFSLKMLHSLSKYYGVEFRPQLGRSAITALLGGASSPMLALAAGSALKSIPIVGYSLAVASGPLVAGGITYALGRVFTAHFGAGGTLFDFDPEKFRDYFQKEIEAGKDFVKGERSQGKDASASPAT